jgi:outer membrane receptor protein involved in Fe transport|tara:strand:+ start:1326 stop:3530 length:2205 start_codon:yes stop_codon:yes gene_type:complete
MKFHTLSIVLASGTSLLALSQPALAQQADEPEVTQGNTIVVTATKRNERIEDVAASVTALSGEELDELNAQSLSDYITRVPGVVFNDYQPGVSEVVIRGVASTTYHEANQATTGYYLNQIPLVEPGFPIVIPDVDTFDLAQVEVLRGPQGTLFGSSSLGGAVNYVVNEADASGFDAGVEGIVSSTRNAGEASTAIKGMVNVPIIEDKLAVRVVALQRYDAGYLDNTLLGEDGSNDLRVRGLRGSIVWTPNETTTVSALSMYQEYELDDQTYVEFRDDFGPFERQTNVPEYQNTSFQLHSLRLDQKLGFATLTAIGSYTLKENDLAFDDSIFVGIDPRTDTAQLSGSAGESETYYGELRLTSDDTGPLNWLIGANYTKLRADSTDRVYIEGIGGYIDANPGEFGGLPASEIAPDDFVQRTVSSSNVREIALFGEASYTLADVLTLTLGGRLFQYRSEPRLQFLPNANLVDPFDYQPGEQTESGFIPKVSLRYQPEDNFMAYALYSEGFRIGGVNVYSAAAGTPLDFGSDSTRNYEVGFKYQPLPGQISIEATAYHIDWEDIQARLFVPVTYEAYTTNGGGAEIDGVEVSLNVTPAEFMSLSTNVSYSDARLSALLPSTDVPGGGYAAGTKLPGASDWTLSNRIDFRLPISGLEPRLGFAHRWLSEAPVAFGNALEKGDYHLLDINADITLANGLELGIFVKNVFDEYAILNAPFGFAGSVTRPRTVGASLRFDLY